MSVTALGMGGGRYTYSFAMFIIYESNMWEYSLITIFFPETNH